MWENEIFKVYFFYLPFNGFCLRCGDDYNNFTMSWFNNTLAPFHPTLCLSQNDLKAQRSND